MEFLFRGQGYTLFLKPTEAVLSLTRPADVQQSPDVVKTIDGPLESPEPKAEPPTVLRMQLVGANTSAKVTGLDQLPGKTNYLIGNGPAQWRTNIANFARVQYQDVYPGIELGYYGNQRQLEYDFIVAPGSDPSVTNLGFDGADQFGLDGQGNLVVTVDGGQVGLLAPVMYQESNGVKNTIPGYYTLNGNNGVGLEIGDYDPTKRLAIDPVLVYSSYLGGGASDIGRDIAVDSQGNAYVTDWILSSDFPTEPSGNGIGNHDAFVTKVNAAVNTQNSKKLNGADAQALLDIVNAIIAAI